MILSLDCRAGHVAEDPANTHSGRPRRVPGGLLVLSIVVTIFMLQGTHATLAVAAPSAWWHVSTRISPSTLKPGGEGTLALQAINVGDASTSGPVTLTATLPKGASVVERSGAPQVSFFAPLKATHLDFGPAGPLAVFNLCQVGGTRVTCSTMLTPETAELEPFLGEVAPFEQLEMLVSFKENGVVSGSSVEAQVSGGNAASVSKGRSLVVDEAGPAFGAEELSLTPEEEGGATDTHAGSHPFQLTNTFSLNQSGDPARPPAAPRNLYFKLPPGQLGNATAVPKCSAPDFAVELKGNINRCPSSTVVGVAVLTFDESAHLGLVSYPVPIFSLEPKRGEPIRFGFVVLGTPVILDTSLRSGAGEDYGVTVSPLNITEVSNLISSTVTFWGTPSDPRHEQSIGWGCLASHYWSVGSGAEIPCLPSVREANTPAFLTMPTNCAAPYTTTVEGISWPRPGSPGGVTLPPLSASLQDSTGAPLGLVGCNELPFSPTIEAKPTATAASSPSGLDVNLDFRDDGLTNPMGVAQSALKDITVTLPEGFTINPSSGVGLGGCRPADYARESIESPPGTGCPNNSKLGTVEIETPLLAQKIHGSLFIAQPYENPFASLIAIYIVAKEPETGIMIKLAGRVTPNPVTGQLVTTFENNPQLPFSHFNFHFREGQQAPLISPATCGTFTTKADLTPWSEPMSTLTDFSSFTITTGAAGGPCPVGLPPFQPQLEAGTLNNNAGTFSPFDLRLTRTDGEQEIATFSTSLPPGLTGVLSGIPFCPETSIELARTKSGVQEEAEPSCPATSQLGHTLVGTGVGAVLAYVPGKIYLAGPYRGDPFSLVSVTSAVVGPFDLGTVVIRFGLRIDPTSAQVSVDPAASEPIPHIIDGIVTHVRDIRVYVDRPDFILNPTSCTPTTIASTLGSNLGQTVAITSPFQTANCADLKFQPKVAVTTGALATKANGASLNFRIAYPKGALGTQSWFNEAKFDIPKQLPARLTTIQKACLAATFETNRAACPAASKIGHATVHTPVLPVPLEGPVYFVSYGSAKFPDAVLVLDGYGVHIELHGETFINGKTGVTSATFRNTPDVPFESIEVSVPAGPFSEFGANLPLKAHGSFCGQKLVMPTFFKAQNGLQIRQNTAVTVTGCPKTRTTTRAQKLKASLKACHKQHGAKRKACEAQARRRYGPKKRK